MSEWPNEHAWKACVRLARTVGSNPIPSAITVQNWMGWEVYPASENESEIPSLLPFTLKNMRHPNCYWAVYGIIRDSSGKILFQRRANTDFNEGILQLPSGHMEWEETYFEALRREMFEELGIEIYESEVKLAHILHRINRGERVYFDIFYEIESFHGNIENKEPDKCSELDFFEMFHPDITPFNLDVLKHIQNKILCSEIIVSIHS